MLVFILEDNKFRIEFFKEKLKKHDLFITDSVEDFIKELNKRKPDYLFLDHDLDQRTFVDINEPNTGSALARYISRSALKFNTIVIHSMNDYGASYMADLLKPHTNELIVMDFSALMRNME